MKTQLRRPTRSAHPFVALAYCLPHSFRLLKREEKSKFHAVVALRTLGRVIILLCSLRDVLEIHMMYMIFLFAEEQNEQSWNCADYSVSNNVTDVDLKLSLSV